MDIKSGVPQGSPLGFTLLSILYLKYIFTECCFICRRHNSFFVLNIILKHLTEEAENQIIKMKNWFNRNKLWLNLKV